MRKPNKHPSKLDLLTPEQRQAVFAHCEKVSLDEGARWLMDTFNIQLDSNPLGAWLKKRRTAITLPGFDQKTRPDSRLGVLSDDLQDAVFDLCANVPLEKGVRLAKEKLDIQIGKTSLGNWLRKRRVLIDATIRRDKLREASECATLVRKAFGSTSEITDTNVAHFAQAVFEEFSKPAKDRDDKRLVPYMALTLKARDQELKAHCVQLSVEKFKASLRTKLEIALHALAREIQGNESAKVKYLELRDQLARDTVTPA